MAPSRSVYPKYDISLSARRSDRIRQSDSVRRLTAITLRAVRGCMPVLESDPKCQCAVNAFRSAKRCINNPSEKNKAAANKRAEEAKESAEATPGLLPVKIWAMRAAAQAAATAGSASVGFGRIFARGAVMSADESAKWGCEARRNRAGGVADSGMRMVRK